MSSEKNTVASTRCVRVEATDSCSQKVETAQVWPDLSPPTVLLTPALVGSGSFEVQVKAPTIWFAESVVPPRLALAVTASAT